MPFVASGTLLLAVKTLNGGPIGGETIYSSTHTINVALQNAIAPEVTSITGCARDVGNETLDCSTEGGFRITLHGNNLASQDGTKVPQVTIGGRPCFNAVTPTNSSLECTLQSGVGVQRSVSVMINALISLPVTFLSYAAPDITRVDGCTSQSATDISDCKREGGNRIVIRGANFGLKGAKVLIGYKQCANVTHVVGFEHRQISCTLPSGNLVPSSLFSCYHHTCFVNL